MLDGVTLLTLYTFASWLMYSAQTDMVNTRP